MNEPITRDEYEARQLEARQDMARMDVKLDLIRQEVSDLKNDFTRVKSDFWTKIGMCMVSAVAGGALEIIVNKMIGL